MMPLKEATAEKHKQAERMPFNMRMFKGELSEEEYLLYLQQQLQIFKTMENKGLPSDALARVGAVQADIDELEAKGYSARIVLKSTKNYTDYLSALNAEEILPHVYLNYLAIMFGGQIMKEKVPSSGKMYEFENGKEGMMAIRKVQKDEWADEVNKAYEYVIDIFEELESP